MKENFEIERKFLIEYPSQEALGGAEYAEITQTYLTAPKNEERRVRRIKKGSNVIYFKTSKKRVSDVKRIEEEQEITESEYLTLLKNADPDRRTIEKTRYVFSYLDKLFEVDIYPFWDDKAIAEVELKDENEDIIFPDFLKIIKEVTNDANYKNSALARDTKKESIC